jgi:hypothetical protein
MEKKNVRSKLVEALKSRAFVKVTFRHERWPYLCCVLDVGPRWVLLALLEDSGRFNGFECLRVEDVRGVSVDPSAAFHEVLLSKRGERRPKKPRVSLRSISALLSSAGRAFPLVTIHTERNHPNECYVGRVQSANAVWLKLLHISPEAKWERNPTSYRVGQITRIQFGDGYSAALHLVGGDPKSLKLFR